MAACLRTYTACLPVCRPTSLSCAHMSKPPVLVARYKIYYDIVEVMGCDTNAMQNAEPRSRSNSISWQSKGAEAGSSAEYLSNYQTGMKLSRHCFTPCFPKTDCFSHHLGLSSYVHLCIAPGRELRPAEVHWMTINIGSHLACCAILWMPAG